MRKIVTLLLIFNALNAFSDTVSLTLENAVQKAYENDKGIKSSKLELENAKLDKWMAFKSGLPTVTYNAQTSVDGDLSKAYLSLNQTIFDGGKTIIAIKSSNKYLDLGEYKLENTKNSVELTVINQYITILSNQKQLEIYKNSKKELESSYQKIQRKYELGLVNKTDVLDMNYSLINLDSSIIQVENALEISKLNLKNTLGLNKSDDIQLEEIENLDVEVLNIDFSKDIEQAKETSLTAKTSRVTTELQKASEGTSRATLLPEVSLNVLYGNLEYVDGNLKEAVKEEHIDSATSITISGTLFDWGSNWDSYKQAKNKTKIASPKSISRTMMPFRRSKSTSFKIERMTGTFPNGSITSINKIAVETIENSAPITLTYQVLNSESLRLSVSVIRLRCSAALAISSTLRAFWLEISLILPTPSIIYSISLPVLR